MIWWGFFRLTAQAAMPLPVGLTKARTLKVSRDFKKSHKTFETCENWKFQCKIQWKLSFWCLLLRNFKKIWNFLSKIYFFAEIFVVILFVALLHSRNISSFPCQKHKKIFYKTFRKSLARLLRLVNPNRYMLVLIAQKNLIILLPYDLARL